MKTAHRIRSFIMVFFLLMSLLSMFYVHANAASVTLSEMLERAESIVNFTWVPSQRIYTWNGNPYNGKTYFESGQVVVGMPYTLFSWELGTDSLLSLSQYKDKVSSNYSTTTYCKSVDENRTGPVYGSCCATFVSEVLGGSYMNGSDPRFDSVYAIEHNNSYGTTYYNVKVGNIQPGDALSNSTTTENGGHIVWVGAVTDTTITIYEQTPPVAKKTVLSKSSVNSSGYLVYGEDVYSTVTRSNELINTIVPGKPSLTGIQSTYEAGDDIVFTWEKTENTTHYNVTVQRLNSNQYLFYDAYYSVKSGYTIALSDGAYRARVTAKNSYYYTEDGSDWVSTVSDWVYFVVGEHNCDKGEYAFFEKDHPHYSCYICSMCGDIWRDYSAPNFYDPCLECHRPGKPVLLDLNEVYTEDEEIVFCWEETENTTHYNLSIATKNNCNEWENYEQVYYAQNGLTRSLPAGEYRIILSSKNSNYFKEDGSDWLTTSADYRYFTVNKSAYTISYNANGGDNAPNAQTKKYNENMILSNDVPTRRGYDFLGWATTNDAVEVEYQPGDVYAVNSNVMLYAVWEHIHIGTVNRWNVVLEDAIKLNFHLQISNSIINTAKIKTTVADDTMTYYPSNLEQDKDGCYIVSIRIAPALMNEPVVIMGINDGEIGSVSSYTVYQYCANILKNSEYSKYHVLVKEMLNYGAMAQVYFNYDAENLANEGIADVATTDIPEIAEEWTVSDNINGLSFHGASLVYRDRIAVRYYFTGDVTGCAFTANGNTYTPVAKDGMYYIEIAEILPQNLDQQITLTATDASGNTLSVTYGPMNYIVRMNEKGSDALKALVKALYNYHLAAKAL